MTSCLCPFPRRHKARAPSARSARRVCQEVEINRMHLQVDVSHLLLCVETRLVRMGRGFAVAESSWQMRLRARGLCKRCRGDVGQYVDAALRGREGR